MDFPELVRTFEQAPAATDSFKVLYRQCFDLMKTDPENAALLFILGKIAQAFVRRYEDQGLDPAFVDETKAYAVRVCRKLLAAMGSTPMERLVAAGEVATEYEWHVTAF
jgi:hypothetical protein